MCQKPAAAKHVLDAIPQSKYPVLGKGFPAFQVGLVGRMTAATAAVTLACLFTERLCHVFGRLDSSYVLSTRIGLHRIELINKTLVNDDFSKRKI